MHVLIKINVNISMNGSLNRGESFSPVGSHWYLGVSDCGSHSHLGTSDLESPMPRCE